jgi:hypothetical protein
MAASKTIRNAEGIAEKLAGLAMNVVVECSPKYDLSDIVDPTIIIVPKDRVSEIETKEANKVEYFYEVGFLKKMGETDTVDVLLAVVEEIEDRLTRELVCGIYSCVEVDHTLLYSISALANKRQFVSVMTVRLVGFERH